MANPNQPQNVAWVPRTNGDGDPYAVRAGIDSGVPVYVARASHCGGVVPGKLLPGHKSAYIPHDSLEVSVREYQVLVAPPDTLSWVPANGGVIPPHAIHGGTDPRGGEYFVGRVLHNGTVTPGKAYPQHGCCYVCYGGKEHQYTEYEVLVKNLLGRTLNV